MNAAEVAATHGDAHREGRERRCRCLWCDIEFTVIRKRGSDRRFCSKKHKDSFW
jgi:hypothetical protein